MVLLKLAEQYTFNIHSVCNCYVQIGDVYSLYCEYILLDISF